MAAEPGCKFPGCETEDLPAKPCCTAGCQNVVHHFCYATFTDKHGLGDPEGTTRYCWECVLATGEADPLVAAAIMAQTGGQGTSNIVQVDTTYPSGAEIMAAPEAPDLFADDEMEDATLHADAVAAEQFEEEDRASSLPSTNAYGPPSANRTCAPAGAMAPVLSEEEDIPQAPGASVSGSPPANRTCAPAAAMVQSEEEATASMDRTVLNPSIADDEIADGDFEDILERIPDGLYPPDDPILGDRLYFKGERGFIFAVDSTNPKAVCVVWDGLVTWSMVDLAETGMPRWQSKESYVMHHESDCSEMTILGVVRAKTGNHLPCGFLCGPATPHELRPWRLYAGYTPPRANASPHEHLEFGPCAPPTLETRLSIGCVVQYRVQHLVTANADEDGATIPRQGTCTFVAIAVGLDGNQHRRYAALKEGVPRADGTAGGRLFLIPLDRELTSLDYMHDGVKFDVPGQYWAHCTEALALVLNEFLRTPSAVNAELVRLRTKEKAPPPDAFSPSHPIPFAPRLPRATSLPFPPAHVHPRPLPSPPAPVHPRSLPSPPSDTL